MQQNRSRRRTLELLGATGLAALAGCLGDSGEDDDPETPENGSDDSDDEALDGGRLTVQVTTDSADPIEGARTTVAGGDLEAEERTTDADGEAVYEGLEPDTYDVEVETGDFGSETGVVPVGEGSDVTRPFSFET